MANGNGNNGGTHHGRLQVITERTLLPIGLVILLTGAGITIGRGIERFIYVQQEVKKHDTRLWLIEDSLATWRREIENRVDIKLSDPKPKPATTTGDDDDGNINGIRTTTAQDHHLQPTVTIGSNVLSSIGVK